MFKIMVFGDPFPTECGVRESMPFTERFASLCNFVSGRATPDRNFRAVDSSVD